MKNKVLKAVVLLLGMVFLSGWLPAQVEFTTQSPVEYSNYIVTEQEKVGELFIGFSNTLLSTNDIKTNENKRQEVVRQLELSLRRLRNMAPFEGGTLLRNEAVEVFEAYRDLHLNEYAKLAILVSNKENSLQALEDYFVIQVKGEKRMKELAVKLNSAQAKFAKKYNLTLLENAMQEQFDRILEANIYTREVFLEYIAVAKVNELWWNAMEASDIAKMNQARTAILDASKLCKLGTMPDFHGDPSFRDAAKARVDYFVVLCNSDYKEIAGILESTKRTKEDVDFVNKAIDSYNEKSMTLNQKFNDTHRQLKLNALPAQSGGGGRDQ